ncbi:MAG: hypothetical protein IJW70_11370 [Clostridia bacterium]|nr:hypothetical protein [Clostridia bacterium]
MDKALLKRLGKSVLRSVLVFFVFALVTIVSRFVFDGELEHLDMLHEQVIPSWLLGLWHVFYMLLIFESTVFAFHRYAAEEKAAYLEKRTGVGLRAELGAVFGLPEFYVDCASVAIFSLALPLGLYDCIGQALPGANFGNFPMTLIALVLLFALLLVARLSLGRMWISDSLASREGKKKKKERSALFLTIKGIAFVGFAYIVASYAITWFLPFLVTVANLGGGMIVFLYLFIALLIAIVAVVAVFYIRAMLKRKKFVKELQMTCQAKGVALSKIQKPYWSVLSQQKGTDFTLEKDGKEYQCKLVAGVFRSSPIVFADTGEGVRQDVLRVFRVSVLHMNTLIDFRMEGDGKKILIVLPVPEKIYVSTEGSTPRPADTGEVLGEYTLYTATGFLGALERGIL